MFKLFKKKSLPKAIPGNIKPVVLLVLDGFGIAPPSDGNAITKARTPNYDRLRTIYPFGQLIASGESVGLPANEEGNSEVGHLTIGAGKVVLQSLMQINASIEDQSFFDNLAFYHALEHTKKFKSKFHILGMIGSGETHSSMDHFNALIQYCQKKSVEKVYLHLITDGRDSPPNEAKKTVTAIQQRLKAIPNIQIATIAGRYFAMDRDARWERTQKAYEAMVLGRGVIVKSPLEIIDAAYKQGKSDEFIEPSVITTADNRPVATVSDNDAVIFFNFRIDRPRQLTMAFTMSNFEKLKDFRVERGPYYEENRPRTELLSGETFKREKWPQNVFFVTMTEYQKNIPVSAIAYPPQKVEQSLAKTISDHGLKQFHLSESEKERMVTYYFNGLQSAKNPGEEVLIIPSPKVSTYDKKPEMSAPKIVEEFINALNKSIYHFFIINLANPDMVAHTGNLKATIKAVEETDKTLGQIAEAIITINGTLIITADHGNAEELIKYPSGSYFFTSEKGNTNTSHSNNPVPVLILSQALAGKPQKIPQGSLGDLAPTILSIMNIPVPSSMTGHNLLSKDTI